MTTDLIRGQFCLSDLTYKKILRFGTALAVATALSGCGSGRSGSAIAGVATDAATVGLSNILFTQGVQAVRATVPVSDLNLIRYDLSPGMSYSYGFSVADYDGSGRPSISYFDSFGPARARLRTKAGAVGNMVWNNGDRDVIVANETFEFQSSSQATNSSEYLFERHVPADINSDGKLDIVGVSNSHAAVVAYINPGVRGVPWKRRVLSSHTPGPVNLAVADINGDGRPDVVVAMRYQPSTNAPDAAVGIAWLENTGLPTGEWIYHVIDTTPGDFIDPRTVQVGNIGSSGRPDVLTTDSGTGAVVWYSQEGANGWTRHPIAGVSTLNAHFGQLVDMDGDGLLDILIPVTQGVAWLHNIAHGSYWDVHPVVQFTDANWSNVVTEVVAGDVHHAGKLDIVFSVGSLSGGANSPHSGGLYIAQRFGAQWAISKIYQTENSVVGTQLVNFDGTGVLSIVSNTEYQQNAVTLWQNQLGL